MLDEGEVDGEAEGGGREDDRQLKNKVRNAFLKIRTFFDIFVSIVGYLFVSSDEPPRPGPQPPA